MKLANSAKVFRFRMQVRGYGYCYIIPVKLRNDDVFYFCQVFDLYTIDKLFKPTPDELLEKGYLLNLLPITGYPRNRGVGAWLYLGEIPGNNNNFIPDFKYTIQNILFDESKVTRWYAYNGVDGKSDKSYKYDKVKHLEHFHLYTHRDIEIRACMEILKRENKKIDLFFNINESDIREHYYRTINMPFYNDIPDNIKGKAIIPKKKINPFS